MFLLRSCHASMSPRFSRHNRKRKNAIARKNAIRSNPPTVASTDWSESTTTTSAISAMIRNPRRVAFISVKKRFTIRS